MLSKSSKSELGFVHYITKFTISRFVISRFECIYIGLYVAKKNFYLPILPFLPTFLKVHIHSYTMAMLKKGYKLFSVILNSAKEGLVQNSRFLKQCNRTG